MAAPVSLLRGARAFARDMPREAMAPGYLWDVCDFVPLTIDSPLTSRGAWIWGSDASAAVTADYDSGILAPYSTGEKHLAASGGQLFEIGATAPYTPVLRGAVPPAKHNPVMLFDQVIWQDGTGANPPSIVGTTGAPVVLTGKPTVRVGTIWGNYFVGGNNPTGGHEDTVYWSPPSDVTGTWDPNALFRTRAAVTGLAGMRNAILVFHASSVERLRGSRPPAGSKEGDMVLEPLFNQIGTTEPKSICYWQESVIFADEHGVHITDGTALRNLIQQGQIQTYWRNIYEHKISIAAAVFLDYYIVTIIRDPPRPPIPEPPSGLLAFEGEELPDLRDRPPVPSFDPSIPTTLVCDLNTRQWFRFSNVAARSLWSSGGTVGMERMWGGISNTKRVARLSPMLLPLWVEGSQQDANGVNVLPTFETPFYRLSAEGRKRIRFAYLSYDVRDGVTDNVLSLAYQLAPQAPNYIVAGGLPSTEHYSRFRLPVGKSAYGIAFQVMQLQPSWVTRISDLAVDAHAIERGRI